MYHIKNFEEFIRESKQPAYRAAAMLNEGKEPAPTATPVEITADFIKNSNPEELGKAFFEFVTVSMYQASNDIDQAMDIILNGGKAVKEGIAETLTELKGDAEQAKKFIEGIGTAVVTSLTKGYDYTKKTVTAYPSFLMATMGFLIKLSASEFDMAKEGLKKIYAVINDSATKMYNELKGNLKELDDTLENKYNSARDKIEIFTGVCWSILGMTAKKFTGAAETFGNLIKQIVADAKEKNAFAVMVACKWDTKDSELTSLFKSVIDEETSEMLSKVWRKKIKGDKMRSDYVDIFIKVHNWIVNAKVNAGKLNEKIPEITGNGDGEPITLKDAAPTAAIKKSVKALDKKKYPLEKVVDMVTKAYNEN